MFVLISIYKILIISTAGIKKYDAIMYKFSGHISIIIFFLDVFAIITISHNFNFYIGILFLLIQ